MEHRSFALSEGSRRSLTRAVAELRGGGPVIVVVVSGQYASMLDNWLYHMEALGIDRILVVAMDEALEGRLAEAGIGAARCDFDGSPQDFWFKRMLIWDFLIDEGIDIIHSDVDAIWFKNPIERYFVASGCDIVWTQATRHPNDICMRWGFVLCTGLFWARSGEAAKSFFSAVKSRSAELLATDDQAVINRLLYESKTVWDASNIGGFQPEWFGRPFTCFNDVLQGECASFGLRLAMLPYRLFPRTVGPGEEAFVKHLYFRLPRGARYLLSEDRLAQMRDAGCWLMDERPPRL